MAIIPWCRDCCMNFNWYLTHNFLKIINDQEVCINYWVVTDDQAAFSLCKACKWKLFWPGYVYVMRFLDVDNLIHASTKTTCSKKEILEALEGVFLLEYRLSVDDSTELYSGWSCGEFRWRYIKRLWQDEERIEEIMCMRAFMLIYVYTLLSSLDICTHHQCFLTNHCITEFVL